MVQINELRVTKDRKYIIIDVQVQDLSYYENVVLDKIYIDTIKTFNPTGPSSKQQNKEQVLGWKRIDCDGVKHIRTFVSIEEMVADTMFFIWIYTSGEESVDTPCGMRKNPTLSVTYDKYPLYVLGMKALNTVTDCTPSDMLKDYIFNAKGLELALKSGDCLKAIDYWKALNNKEYTSISNNCGCNGIH